MTMLEKGASKEEIIEAADYFISHIRHVFTVETLAYLIKGGRLTRLKGTLAETLDMKPVLIVNEEGALAVIKTVRGRKKSLRYLIDYAKEHIYEPGQQTIALCHGEDMDSLNFVNNMVQETFHPKKTVVSVVGCAIGAHTGRGIVGFCFFDADDGKFAKYFTD